MRNIEALLPKIVSPFDWHCSSCGALPDSAYVTAPLIGIGVAEMSCSHSGSEILDRTIAFDRAEAERANLTQTNMITVSSFNGINGMLLGYDLLKQPLCRHPLIPHSDVYDASPLFDATLALLGTVKEKRFPIAPGQHLLCASKTLSKVGACVLYGALAIGIPERRDINADLFMEDVGTMTISDFENDCRDQERMVLGHLIDAVHKIGDNLGVRYKSVFAGLRSRTINEGEIGCVLTAAPYLHLARKAIPGDCPQLLSKLSLPEWEALVSPCFLQT